MKTFASASFFRLLDRLVDAGNPSLRRPRWSFEGVEFEYGRHSFTGSAHGFSIQTFTLSSAGRRGWSLLVVKEFWQTGDATDAARMTRWARPTGGRRGDIVTWLRTREMDLERAENGQRVNVNGGLERKR
jgi:hypothetical protein